MEPKLQTEPQEWTIDSVTGGPNRNEAAQLLNCHIYRDAFDNYQFLGPRGTYRSAADSPGIPFNFPVFSAPLNGSVLRSWYLRVTYVSDTVMMGTWGNSHYHESVEVGPDYPGPFGDSDTWTAQAGVGEEIGDNTEKDTEKTKEAAASASPKP